MPLNPIPLDHPLPLSTGNELFGGLGDGGFLGPLAADSQGAPDKLRVDG
jgi:hypothetical protein